MKLVEPGEPLEFVETVRYRIVRGDAKGRPYGTPRNPRLPTIEEFNPRLVELLAGEVSAAIRERRHGLFPAQVESVRRMSNDELLRFSVDDPMSGVEEKDGFRITGGHHRLNEITQRVEAGTLPKIARIRILLHD